MQMCFFDLFSDAFPMKIPLSALHDPKIIIAQKGVEVDCNLFVRTASRYVSC